MLTPSPPLRSLPACFEPNAFPCVAWRAVFSCREEGTNGLRGCARGQRGRVVGWRFPLYCLPYDNFPVVTTASSTRADAWQIPLLPLPPTPGLSPRFPRHALIWSPRVVRDGLVGICRSTFRWPVGLPGGAVHKNRDGGGRVLAEGAGAAVLQAFGRRRGVFVTAVQQMQQGSRDLFATGAARPVQDCCGCVVVPINSQHGLGTRRRA